MAQPARAEVEMHDFLGLVTNVDSGDLPAGAAQDQVNAAIIKQAQMDIRRGYLQVTFED